MTAGQRDWPFGKALDRETPEAQERTKRFFGLRESGWTGPIDQDGRAVMARTDSKGRPLRMDERQSRTPRGRQR